MTARSQYPHQVCTHRPVDARNISRSFHCIQPEQCWQQQRYDCPDYLDRADCRQRSHDSAANPNPQPHAHTASATMQNTAMQHSSNVVEAPSATNRIFRYRYVRTPKLLLPVFIPALQIGAVALARHAEVACGTAVAFLKAGFFLLCHVTTPPFSPGTQPCQCVRLCSRALPALPGLPVSSR